MRALVLFHQWDFADDAIDPIAVISETIWDNVEDDEVERIFETAKVAFGCADAPPERFQTAWVTLSGTDKLFVTPELTGEVGEVS